MNKLIIAFVDVTPLQDKAIFKTLYDSVSPYRKNKVDKIALFEDKALSVGAELALRECLKEFGAEFGDIDFVENGKPVFKNNDLKFNLSHSGKYAMCVASSVDVGCDIQQIKDVDLNIAKRFFFNTEYDSIMAQPDYDSQIDMFFRYWTLKESFMKVTGKGFKLPLNEFQIVFDNETPSVNQSLNNNEYSFMELDAPQGYKMSVCACDIQIAVPKIISVDIKP